MSVNDNTANFEQLTNRWGSGDKVYEGSCQLTDTSPKQIFDLAFSGQSNKFFDELIKNKASSPASNDADYTISSWSNQPIVPKLQFTGIQQRKLIIKATENGIAFFLRKNITTNITQTVFFNQDSIIIFSVAQTRTESKESDHMIIDRWTIKFADKSQQNESKNVSVAIKANIIWKTYQSPTATIIKSKWLRFYQSRFETWRDMIKQYIDGDNAKSERIEFMKPFIGIWNKLNSLHTIRIMVDKIEYSDGSQFDVSYNETTDEIIATYSSSQFMGKLYQHDKYDEIRWNNGSVWIKNGFVRFEGEYKHNSTEQKYIIHKFGTIKLPITGKKVRFQLINPNRISYQFNRDITHKGTLSDDMNIIKWDNGSIWEKTVKPKEITINKHSNGAKSADVPMFDKNEENEEIPEESVAEIEEKLDEMEIMNGQKTVEIEGEIEMNEDSDFEQDFDIYFQQNAPSLEIKNYDHFVLIDDDQLFDTNQEQQNINNNVDEWLLV